MYLRHDECDRYWDVFYKRWEDIGYYMGEYVFEIPKWIAEISYFLPEHEKEILYCKHDIGEAISKINQGGYSYVLMSLMNANQDFIYEVIKSCPSQKFLVGGYNDAFMRRMETELPNVRICDTTKDTARELGVDYSFGTDYSLFKGESVIPRLTLSYGCLNKCKFCIVPHGKVTPISNEVIIQQMRSFSHLDYRLVYIDDKTFGQSPNYTFLKDLSNYSDKDDFNGFIVQTTTGLVARKAKEFRDINVRVAEIGLESYNDKILKMYRKPSSERFIRESVDAAHENGLLLIANIIIGLPGETEQTYRRTYDYVMPLLESGRLIGINPAIYTDYDNEQNLGEIDFLKDSQYELNKVWWNKFNASAAEILDKNIKKV
jgi:hypothetical protein